MRVSRTALVRVDSCERDFTLFFGDYQARRIALENIQDKDHHVFLSRQL
jgi:hypothetical protein